MANNFYNYSQFGMFNNAQHPPRNNQNNNNIACRLCNRVFTTYQSLITHLESHMAQENLSMRRLNHINPQRELVSNPLQPNFPRPMPMPMPMQGTRNFSENRPVYQPVMPRTRTNPFPYANHPQVAAPQPLQLMRSAGNNVAEMTQLPASTIHQRDMEVSPIDGTKPLIDLLDKPINNIAFVNLGNINNGDTLNLALRL